MRYMLDTNICIYVIKHKPEKVFQKLQTIHPEDVCISSVTYAELVHGVEKRACFENGGLGRIIHFSHIVKKRVCSYLFSLSL